MQIRDKVAQRNKGQAKDTYGDVLTQRKFRAGTIFLVVSAVINQMSGINAINIYSATILGEIPSLPLEVGIYMLAAANVVGAVIGPAINKCVSIRSMLIAGQFFMATFLALIVIFQLVGVPMGILASMIAFITSYQATIGSYYFVYVSQVTVEAQNSFTVSVFWTVVLILSLTTSSIINGIQITGTFSLFAVITLLGGFYFIVALRSTEGLTTDQAKEVYYPEELKTASSQDDQKGLLVERLLDN